MNPTKILWGQIFLVGAVVLAFIWTATEWTAWRLGFQLQLGAPWFEIFGWPMYQPPAFFWWWFAYDAYARNIFVEGAYIPPLAVSLPSRSRCRFGGRERPSTRHDLWLGALGRDARNPPRRSPQF